MDKRGLIHLTGFLSFLFFTVTPGYSWWGWEPNDLSTIESPKQLEKINAYPVEIVVRFNKGTEPDSFRAWLNSKEITDSFHPVENGLRAFVGPEDGLRFRAAGQRIPLPKINVLKTQAKEKFIERNWKKWGYSWKKDVDIRPFFVKVVKVPEPVTTLVASDNRLLTARIRFPAPVLNTVEAGGETFTRVNFPGLEIGENFEGPEGAGSPGVQMKHLLVAIPTGSTPVLQILNLSSYQMKGINLYPSQPSAVDQRDISVPDGELPPPETFQDPPFTKDEEAYQKDEFFPPHAVTMKVIGQMRDVNVVQVDIAPAQYNPARKVLKINDALAVQLNYEGGDGFFLTSRSANPFDSFNFKPLAEQSFVNGTEIFNYINPEIFKWLCLGEELMIITDPAFVDAANDLKAWKKQKGIVTNVYQTGSVSQGFVGETEIEIKAFIQDHYDHCLIRPSYVLLLGDAEFIPPFYRSSSGSSTTGTDLDYSLMTGGDLLADLGVGRISVDTADQAQVVVDKIINYEKHPVWNPGFYNSAAIAAFFQCCRTGLSSANDGTTSRAYIETVEHIRNALVADGYDAERLYLSNTAYHPTYTGSTTPRFYHNGTALPEDLDPASGFAWNADTQDIIDSVNEGRFLLIHRNHGGQNGWVYPQLTTGDAANLTNGRLLPVLFSVDCATGFFDNETAAGDYGTTAGGVYLLEALLRREGGGVVGALGDTRDSPTWANNALTLGLADAVFPNVLGAYGGATSIRRLADILNYGKTYMFSQVGVTQTTRSVGQSNADSDNIMWHAFGDPTLEIWTSQPFLLPRVFDFELFLDRVVVHYDVECAVITARQGEAPIGRALVVNGQADLKFVDESLLDTSQPIEFSASKADFVSVLLGKPDLAVDLNGPATAAPAQNLYGLIQEEVSNRGSTLASGTVDEEGNIKEGYVIDLVRSADAIVPPGFAPGPTEWFVEDNLLWAGRTSRTPDVEAGSSVVLNVGGEIP